MKNLKLFFGLAALAVCFSFTACSDDDNDNTTPQPQTTVVANFTGYLSASDANQTNAYVGDGAQFTLTQTGNQYAVNFKDATYGTGIFDNVTYDGTNISGNGKVTVPNTVVTRATDADSTTFDAIISGTTSNIQITISGLNGGTTLNVAQGDAQTAIGNLYEGLYLGKDTMDFAMLSGVQPYNADEEPYDSLTIVYNGNNNVTATFKSTLTHTVLGPTFRAHVYGVLSHITFTESGDSIKFSNVQSDASVVPDSIQAAMNAPLTPATKHYAATFTGAVSKKTHLGVFHINTAFGAMGAVNFTSTIKSFEVKK